MECRRFSKLHDVLCVQVFHALMLNYVSSGTSLGWKLLLSGSCQHSSSDLWIQRQSSYLSTSQLRLSTASWIVQHTNPSYPTWKDFLGVKLWNERDNSSIFQAAIRPKWDLICRGIVLPCSSLPYAPDKSTSHQVGEEYFQVYIDMKLHLTFDLKFHQGITNLTDR